MSYRDMNNPIVWIDCEMTGLDLNVDELVEVAVAIIDPELNPVDEGTDVLIRPSDAAVEHMGDFIRQMHTASGLIEEWENGLTLEETREQVLACIRRHIPEAQKTPLGGSSVGTDKAFLEKYMPDAVAHLHYRLIDVSSLRELAKRWYPRTYFATPEKTGNHRALGDIYDSIDELHYCRDALMPAGDGLTTDEARSLGTRYAGTMACLVAKVNATGSPRGQRLTTDYDSQELLSRTAPA